MEEYLRKKAVEHGFKVGTTAGAVMALAWLCQLFANLSPPENIRSQKLLAIASALNFAILSAALIVCLFNLWLSDLATKYEAIAERIESFQDHIYVGIGISLLCTPLVAVYSLAMTGMVIIPCYYIAFLFGLMRLLQKDGTRRAKQSQTTSDELVLSQQSEECDEDDSTDDEDGSMDDEDDSTDNEEDDTDDEGIETRGNDQFEKILRMNEEIWDYMMTTITREVAEDCEKNLSKFTIRIAEENKELFKMKEEKWEQELRQITSKLAEDYDEKLKKNEEKWWKYVAEVGSRYAQENEEILKLNEERWERQLAERTTKIEQDYEKKLKTNDPIKWVQREKEVISKALLHCEEYLIKVVQQLTNMISELDQDYEMKLKMNEDKWEQSFIQFTCRSALDNKAILKENEEKWEQVMSMTASTSSDHIECEKLLGETKRDRQLWEQNLVTITQQYQRDREEWETQRRQLMSQIEGWNILEIDDHVQPEN